MEAVETMCMDTLVTNCSRSTTHKCHASRIYPNLPMSFWTQQRLEQFQRQAQRQWRVRLQLLGQRRRTRSLWSNRRSGLGRPWMDWKAWIWTRRLRWPIPSFPSISPRRNPRVRFNPDDGLLVDGRGRDGDVIGDPLVLENDHGYDNKVAVTIIATTIV